MRQIIADVGQARCHFAGKQAEHTGRRAATPIQRNMLFGQTVMIDYVFQQVRKGRVLGPPFLAFRDLPLSSSAFFAMIVLRRFNSFSA